MLQANHSSQKFDSRVSRLPRWLYFCSLERWNLKRGLMIGAYKWPVFRRQPQSAMLVQQCTGQASACHIHKNPLTMHEHLFCNMPCTSLVSFFFTKIVRKLPIADCPQFLTGANLLGHHFLICFAWSIFKPSFATSFLVKWRFIIIKRWLGLGLVQGTTYISSFFFAK